MTCIGLHEFMDKRRHAQGRHQTQINIFNTSRLTNLTVTHVGKAWEIFPSELFHTMAFCL